MRHTILYPRNANVDAINNQELAKLPGESVVYEALDRGRVHMLKDLKAPAVLELKLNAQVMLVKNLNPSQGLVNGTRGTVTAFQGDSQMPVVTFNAQVGDEEKTVKRALGPELFDLSAGEVELAAREQIPLMLAWAMTVHKSQGLTISHLELSLSHMFESGQGYVALSRASDMEGLRLMSWNPSCIKADQEVKDFYKCLGYDENASEEVEEYKKRVLVSKLCSEFQQTTPNVTDYKCDAAWLDGNQTGAKLSGAGVAGKFNKQGSSGDAFQSFDDNFNAATKGWKDGGQAGPRVGPFSNIQSMWESSIDTSEYGQGSHQGSHQPMKKDFQQNRTSQVYGGQVPSSHKGLQGSIGVPGVASSQTASFTDTGNIDAGYMQSLEANKKRQLEISQMSQSVPEASIMDLVSKIPAPPVKVAKTLTEEQRQRMEENKRKALEKRAQVLQQQQKLQQQQSVMFKANFNM